MKRIQTFLKLRLRGIYQALMRFPMSVAGFVAAAVVTYRIIAMDMDIPVIYQKWIFTLIVGAVLGIAVQFAVERFDKLAAYRLAVYGAGLLLSAGYFFILLPAPELSLEITTRSIVAVFSLICMVLWVPSFGGKADFNRIALVHFKSFFTSLLYAGVLSAGLSAILAAVDTLLFNVPNDTYAYTMTTVWVIFAPVYFLSLLPEFNHVPQSSLKASADGEGTDPASDHERLSESVGAYPKFLEILVSYIAIPLIGAYTAVLLAYFAKILITFEWPSGQLGPMVLVYAIAGLLIFVLASPLENKFAGMYRLIFPKILIPVVIMQLVSVGIRLNAYGVTESRYYVALFGVFSLISGVLLSFNPVSKNGRIALLAAAFALVSILPPVDAFTVSRVSQIRRVETILSNEGILVNGELIPKADASESAKLETTNILNYLERSSSLEYIEWLPEDFEAYRDMKNVFGFEPHYANFPGSQRYTSASIDARKPVGISGYDLMTQMYLGSFEKELHFSDQAIEMKGQSYRLLANRTSTLEVSVSLLDEAGQTLVEMDIDEAAQGILPEGSGSQELKSPEEMTVDVENGKYRMRVIFQNININENDNGTKNADYNMYVLLGVEE